MTGFYSDSNDYWFSYEYLDNNGEWQKAYAYDSDHTIKNTGVYI